MISNQAAELSLIVNRRDIFLCLPKPSSRSLGVFVGRVIPFAHRFQAVMAA